MTLSVCLCIRLSVCLSVCFFQISPPNCCPRFFNTALQLLHIYWACYLNFKALRFILDFKIKQSCLFSTKSLRKIYFWLIFKSVFPIFEKGGGAGHLIEFKSQLKCFPEFFSLGKIPNIYYFLFILMTSLSSI